MDLTCIWCGKKQSAKKEFLKYTGWDIMTIDGRSGRMVMTCPDCPPVKKAWSELQKRGNENEYSFYI